VYYDSNPTTMRRNKSNNGRGITKHSFEDEVS
jgi:hypothetical protein